ncbi:MAG: hypothetical protein WCF76_16635, partial [Pseudolabrys sp.]
MHQFDCGKYRPFRTAGAEGGRARGQGSERGRRLCLVGDKAARLFRDRVGIDAGRSRVLQERSKALEQYIGRIF